MNNNEIVTIKEITIKQAQENVDQWIKDIGVSYFSELECLASILEELGEVSRVVSRTYGQQSFKKSDEKVHLGDEMADVLFSLICLANKTGVDLTTEFQKNMEKKTSRDKTRHQENEKLKNKQ